MIRRSIRRPLRTALSATRGFDPSQRSECVLWLRADMGISKTGSSIISWANQIAGGSDKDVGQSTSGQRPEHIESDSNFNNCSTVRFESTGVTRYLDSGAWSAALDQPSTWYLAMRQEDAAALRPIFDAVGGSVYRTLYGKDTGLVMRFAAPNNVFFGASYANSPSLICLYFNGASSKGYLNSRSTTSASGNAGTGSQPSLRIGADHAFPLAARLIGEIAEIAVMAGADSDAQRSQMSDYMTNRYNLTVSA